MSDTESTTEVTVTAPYQVNYDGAVYGSGETLTVPAATATLWVQSGWATPTE